MKKVILAFLVLCLVAYTYPKGESTRLANKFAEQREVPLLSFKISSGALGVAMENQAKVKDYISKTQLPLQDAIALMNMLQAATDTLSYDILDSTLNPPYKKK